MIVSLSAGKAGILWRRQNCLNLDIPAAYVALVEGAKASFKRSSKLAFKSCLEFQVLQLVLDLPVEQEHRIE
jgi:hypothetical protein